MFITKYSDVAAMLRAEIPSAALFVLLSLGHRRVLDAPARLVKRVRLVTG
jgi:hypothetical protein